MRDARGRFLPLHGAPADGSDGRHVLSRPEKRKGFRVFVENCRLGKVSSRVAAHVRLKLRAYYLNKSDKKCA